MCRTLRFCCSFLILVVSGVGSLAGATEYLPDRPKRYCNDYAYLLKSETVLHLDRVLEGIEYESSNQVVIAVYRSMRSGATMEEYCQRLAASWHVGRPDKANGIVLFYFARENRFCIAVRPGLQGALPDAEVQRIITERMNPWLKANDFDGALNQGIAAIMVDTETAYKGDMKHAYWLHPPPAPIAWRFKDSVRAFFLFSVLFVPTYLVFSALCKAVVGLFSARAKRAGLVSVTIDGSSTSSVAARRPSAKPASASSRRQVAGAKVSASGVSGFFWDKVFPVLLFFGMIAAVLVGAWLWHVYTHLDSDAYVAVTSVGVAALVLLPAWWARSNWDVFADEKSSDKTPPPYWKIVLSVVGIYGAIVLVWLGYTVFGLLITVLTGGVFAVIGSVLDGFGGSSSGGGGGIFGGGGGASGSY